MTFGQKTIQITLISIGVLLILITYFLYPAIKEKKLKENNTEQEIVKDEKIIIDGKQANIFESVEYKGFYDITNPFTIKSDKAHILSDEQDIVYMTNMHVTLEMKDGRIINIKSDKGRYNKVNYDCFFEKNVSASDGETTIVADNLDLLSTENYASVYNNVILKNDNGSLIADKVNYDFETEFYEISMYDDSAVKIKIIKWKLKNSE